MKGGTLDFVPNRQSWWHQGQNEAVTTPLPYELVPVRDEFAKELNNHTKDIQAEAERTYHPTTGVILPGEWNQTSSEDVVLLDTPAMKVVGNPNGSHGYMYVAAFPKVQ